MSSRSFLGYPRSKKASTQQHGCWRQLVQQSNCSSKSNSQTSTSNLHFLGLISSLVTIYNDPQKLRNLSLQCCTNTIFGRQNKELVKALSVPARGAKELSFPTKHSQSFWTQIVACLWKTKLTYWRSPDYNCVRYFFTFMTGFIIGSMFWGVGKNT